MSYHTIVLVLFIESQVTIFGTILVGAFVGATG